MIDKHWERFPLSYAYKAEKEGWTLIWSSFYGRWRLVLCGQVQSLDNIKHLIKKRAKEGSALHKRALALLALQR